jgi:hypothetical protein
MVYKTPVRSTSMMERLGFVNESAGWLLLSQGKGSHFFSPMPAMGKIQDILPSSAFRAV